MLNLNSKSSENYSISYYKIFFLNIYISIGCLSIYISSKLQNDFNDPIDTKKKLIVISNKIYIIKISIILLLQGNEIIGNFHFRKLNLYLI